MKKYELIKETETCFRRRIMYRRRALKDFSDIKAGDVGGWVCSEDNLSQNGDCWIYDEAKCLDDARVYDNAKMFDNAEMFDDAEICDNARMYHYARMCDNTRMYDNSEMFDDSKMCDNAKMRNDSKMRGNTRIYGNTRMYGITTDKNKLLYGSITRVIKKIFGNN